MRARSLISTASLTLLATSVLFVAGGNAQAAEQRTGWYVVRPGDTLRGITERYLGSSGSWKDNHALNPELPNPHFLVPGQRIRILLGDDLPPRTARLVSVSRQVEENPTPLDWAAASREDLLLERDGLRTREKSSSELELQGGERMVVTENSLVYLKERPEIRRQVRPQSIEIVRGQADLESGSGKASSNRVEILIGNATARPKASAQGASQARARRSEEGTAQVMVFQGESEVSAAGEAVQVAEGMGTSVPKTGKPNPPEKLLAPPVALSPPAEAKRATARPVLQWGTVEGASSYTVEICRDAHCGSLVDRQLGLEEATYTPGALEFGDYYWRATAVSPSGLDGYPSEAAKLTLVAGKPADPPKVEYRAQGPSVSRDDVLYLGPGAELQLRFDGASSGASKLSFSLDGEARGPEVLQGPWSEGLHRLDLGWQDELGNHAQLDGLDFFFDSQAPSIEGKPVPVGWTAPRGLVAMLLPTAQIGSGQPSGTVPPTKKKRKKSKKRQSWSPLDWSGGGWSWQPLEGLWQLKGPQEQLVLRAVGESLRWQEPAINLPEGRRAAILFTDPGAGLESLKFGLLPAGEGGWELQLEVRDQVGNVTAEVWPVSAQ
ncbi:MAG: LysM peptidoglycan-binding domain-containing protein [Deltaproteobacteria bacterium]|nr:LysM peptidoglycan-binding domain-containing protein [Deltaproteobacteria bacterium]